jgi:hypothetical protein
MWACEYGRNSVVEFLLQKAVDVGMQDGDGQTGLHWAVIGGQLQTMKVLMQQQAPLEVENVHGGTVLSQALWCVINGDPQVDYVPVIETLVAAGAKIEPGSLTWLARQEGGSSSAKGRIEDVLRRYGAKS